MTKENLSNSIVLIGPMCVGKSLLSSTLSQKLNIPYINIDELIAMTYYESENLISPDPEHQKGFIQECLEEMQETASLKETIEDPELLNKAKSQIDFLVNAYNKYRKMLGDLTPLHDLCDKYMDDLSLLNGLPEPVLCITNKVTVEIIKYILSKVNTPIIIDTPGTFGWNMDECYFDEDVFEHLKEANIAVDINATELDTQNILKNTNTVFLTPGKDYVLRSDSNYHFLNKFLLRHMGNYNEHADLTITTNGLFNSPENTYFRQRNWYDAKEVSIKEQLMNKGEIANICDEIIYRLQELNNFKSF